MPLTVANGKIFYVELPATDVQRSADFYHKCLWLEYSETR